MLLGGLLQAFGEEWHGQTFGLLCVQPLLRFIFLRTMKIFAGTNFTQEQAKAVIDRLTSSKHPYRAHLDGCARAWNEVESRPLRPSLWMRFHGDVGLSPNSDVAAPSSPRAQSKFRNSFFQRHSW